MVEIVKAVRFRLWDDALKPDGFKEFKDYDEVTEFIRTRLIQHAPKNYVMMDRDGIEVLAFTVTREGPTYPKQEKAKEQEPDAKQLLLPAGMA